MKRHIGRVFAYVILIALGIVGVAPFVYLAILSAKRRIEILDQAGKTVRSYSSDGRPAATGGRMRPRAPFTAPR